MSLNRFVNNILYISLLSVLQDAMGTGSVWMSGERHLADDDSQATGVHLIITKNRNISKEILDILKIPKGRKYDCTACTKYARSMIKLIKVMY